MKTMIAITLQLFIAAAAFAGGSGVGQLPGNLAQIGVDTNPWGTGITDPDLIANGGIVPNWTNAPTFDQPAVGMGMMIAPVDPKRNLIQYVRHLALHGQTATYQIGIMMNQYVQSIESHSVDLQELDTFEAGFKDSYMKSFLSMENIWVAIEE